MNYLQEKSVEIQEYYRRYLDLKNKIVVFTQIKSEQEATTSTTVFENAKKQYDAAIQEVRFILHQLKLNGVLLEDLMFMPTKFSIKGENQ